MLPSRMDGSKPPEWTGEIPTNSNIPEIEILSDSESLWGFTDATQHSPSFINREMAWRRTEYDWEQLASAERRNERRMYTLDEILSQIETLIDAGNEADYNNNTRYNWEHHNREMAWLENQRQITEDNMANSRRNQRRNLRSILRNRIPNARPQFSTPVIRRRRERRVQGFQRY